MKFSILTLAAATAASMCILSASLVESKKFDYDVTIDVKYLADKNRLEKADIYMPKTHDKKKAAMVIVHGGGFTRNDKGDEREQVAGGLLASHGIVAMSINYQMRKVNRTMIFP